MKKMNIGIDIDGTITCTKTFIALLNDAFQATITLPQLKSNKIQHLLNCSAQEFQAWLAQHEHEVYGSLPLVPHAKDVITKWGTTHHIHFITARPQSLEKATADLIKLHELPYHLISLIGKHDKTAAIRALQIDLFLEDNIKNANQISTQCNIPVLLFDMPYNEDKTTAPKTIRIQNWLEADAYLNTITK